MSALLRHAASAADPAGPAVEPGVEHAEEHGEAVRAQARRLLERAQRVAGAEPQPSLVEPLSQRELEVLRLLESELTGPEIARELYVTLNTLRTHTKRIFTKLDARTRAAAVQRARERGLL